MDSVLENLIKTGHFSVPSAIAECGELMEDSAHTPTAQTYFESTVRGDRWAFGTLLLGSIRTYLRGLATHELCKRAHSRDCRPDAPQLLIGLAMVGELAVA